MRVGGKIKPASYKYYNNDKMSANELEEVAYDPELGPDGDDGVFVAITQLQPMIKKGYLPVSYVNYRERTDQFPQSLYMAWAMAGTYYALRYGKGKFTVFDMMTDIKLCPREDESAVNDYEIMGALLLECDRARTFFYRLCEGIDIQVAADEAYQGKNLAGLVSMVSFPENEISAREWCPLLNKPANNTHPSIMFINISGFSYDDMVTPAYELRGLVDEKMDISGMDFHSKYDDHDEEPSCKPMIYKDSQVAIKNTPEKSPNVKHRTYTNKDMQKVFVPQPIKSSNHPFLDWIFSIRDSPATKSSGLDMYSDEHIYSFFNSIFINGELPNWTNNPTVAALVTNISDYTIWRIKDIGLYDRKSMGTINYVDSSYITGAIESLQKKTDRESKAIFNIENMLKTMINHQKSGSSKYQMSDVPTVMPTIKPLYEEEKTSPGEIKISYIAPPL